ncbi:hypothetical protein BBJ28_00024660 [Nothophytophthora sp. Chile5]|nr:hypothetical protein BBJ28_00024660 [Nothophytophthora sp. Chile5]
MDDASAQEQEQQNDESNSSSAQKQSSSNDQDERQEWKPQSQVASNPEQEKPPREKRRDRREPNPYRSPQEAQEHWKKRVEMVERSEDEKEAEKDGAEKQEAAAEMTTAEFVDDEDEDMEDVEHALAAADENQVMNQPQQEEEEEDTEKQDEETDPGAGATAMEVDEEEQDVKKETEESADAKQDKKPKQQEPKSEPEVATEDSSEQAETKPDEQMEKPEDLAKEGDHNLLDDAEQALPSKLRELDLSNGLQDQDEAGDEEPRPVTLLSPEEVAALRDELDAFIAQWSSRSEQERGADLWAKYTALTAGASQRLCEQLRLVLEPMLRAKLEGDFRTGKRINMRKVIPYIASQFRKDKIWLRRTRPSKRQYQVMLAIDDSESMADNHAGRLALEALATLCKGMTQLEVGELAVVKFGQDLQLLHAFDTPFTDDAGSRLIGRFGFQQKKTNMVQTLDAILQLLETAKQAATASSSVEFTQIVFLISDGRFDSDGRVRIRKLIETALERQQLIVLLIVDQGAAQTEEDAGGQHTSILDTQSVTFEKGKVRMVPYLENYPFPYYVLLPTSALLPEILSDSLRQWFEMLQAKN